MNVTNSLSDKHVVITGGGTGVGAAMAEAMAHAGARVTVVGRREGPLREVAAKHRYIGWKVADVTDAETLHAALAEARALSGPIAVAVANAGAAESVPFARMQAEQMRSMLEVNLLGVMNSWQAALGDMQSAGWGRLIAVASTAGLKGYPYVSGYCAAKHGVVGLTRAVALEMAESGITVNAICPGFVETPMLERSVANIMEKTGMDADKARESLMRGNPQKRFIEVDEVAGAALWLCSEAARSVNGVAMSLSGGEI